MRLYTLLFLFIFASCGSRKKALNVTTTKSNVSTEKESKNNIKKDIKELVISDIAIIDIKSDISATFEGKISDSNKPASIEESVKEGVKKTVFTNFKDIKTNTRKKDNKKQSKENIKESLIDKSNESIQEKEKENKKNEVKNKSLDVERESSNSWVLWLILALGLLAAGYYVYNKKANPFNWF
jgi:hypothetical protein